MLKLHLVILAPVMGILIGATILEGADGFAKALIICSAVYALTVPISLATHNTLSKAYEKVR